MSISPSDPHQPLRDDVKQFGRLLGEVIQQQEGQALYTQIESIRQWGQQAAQGDVQARQALDHCLATTDADTLCDVARAFGHFLNLANIAEQYHRIRRRRSRADRLGGVPAPGSLRAFFTRALASGVQAAQLRAAVSNLAIDLVLTAHPTEVARRTLIQKHDAIAASVERLDQIKLTRNEREREFDGIRRLLVAAWETDEIRAQRPTPVDEAKWGFATIETSLWHAMPACLRELDAVMLEFFGERLPLAAAPIRIGSWMGGDRDGNPFVTATVTREVILLARWMAVDLYLRDLEVLRYELSSSRCGPALRARVGADSREPYRDWLKSVRDRLQATQLAILAELEHRPLPIQDDSAVYRHSQELFDDLQFCHADLHEAGLKALAEGALLDTLRRISCFGLPLLRLDVRQESTRHAEALDAVTRYLGLGSYLGWSEAERQAFLLAELANPRPLLPASVLAASGAPADSALDVFTADVREVLKTFQMLASQPTEALGAYVISMAKQPSDVLAVLLLQRKAAVPEPMRVVPLFETYTDLQQAADCLEALLSLPEYKAAINGRQEIMIGYSDSAKDAGFIAAAWAQYQAQEGLTAVAARHGVKLVLFHGRGGSVSRGGAPTHQALRSQPPGSVNGAIRVTEQGEMIRMKFGLPAEAQRSLERYLSSTLEATLMPPPPPEENWRKLMDQLSASSMKVYREQVREHPAFISYLRTVTPELELQLLPLGSRPARRTVGGGIETLRAIPWVFAWTQIRLMLPAWLGVLEALQAVPAAEREEELRTMALKWPFFASLLDMLEMVMAKSDTAIARHYEQTLTEDTDLHALGAALRQQHASLIDMLASIQSAPDWPSRNPVLAQSIRLRTPYLLPLHLLQAELMRRRRRVVAERGVDAAAESTDFDHGLMVTMTGIAAGLRNTG